ncbi:MAG: GNAT family N-acetyltransferase, partial [Thermoleophilia bacterium]|nr:GNAT family N-acetyltransferase [Thermoleophilia bacterium]
GDIVQPPKFNSKVEVRALDPDDTDAWYDVIELWVEAREEGHSEAAYRAYSGRAARHRRSLVRAGKGIWNAAFIGDQLVGSMGVFVFEGRGRFQAVDTHPDFRRQGICGRLVHDTALSAFENFDASELVMVAGEGYHAASIYESCGFTPSQHTPAVEWWPRASQ